MHDEGDCKVMLGEECVGALQEQYKEQGVRDMMRGRCHDGGVGEWNLSIPWECVGLVGGGERWLGGMFASGMFIFNHSLTHSLYSLRFAIFFPRTFL